MQSISFSLTEKRVSQTYQNLLLKLEVVLVLAYEMSLSNKVTSKLINLEPWLNNSLGTASIPLAASMEPLTV